MAHFAEVHFAEWLASLLGCGHHGGPRLGETGGPLLRSEGGVTMMTVAVFFVGRVERSWEPRQRGGQLCFGLVS